MKINSKLNDIYKKDIIKESKALEEFTKWYDSYRVNPLLSYITREDIKTLHDLAISPRMNCDVQEKYYRIGRLMEDRGFALAGGGTNRRCYHCVYDNRVVIKAATDQVGFISNLREGVNQNVIKPFCDKIFEVSDIRHVMNCDGTVSLEEQVIPIKTVEEFQKYAQDIYDILYFKIRNNNIGMEDIGTRSFKNWGYRNGFGPVLLDFPTMYVLDPKKRLCRNIINGHMCGGTLDYDEGFNVIVCSECGCTHFAASLAKKDGDNISELMQAVGYQNQKSVKEQNAMKIRIVDENNNVEVREIGGKSTYVNPNNCKRGRVKPIIDLNNPNVNQPQERKVKFKVEVIGETKPEQENTVEAKKPPVNPDPSTKIDNIVNQLESGKQNPTIEDRIKTETKQHTNRVYKVSMDEAFNLYKLLFMYTVAIPLDSQFIKVDDEAIKNDAYFSDISREMKHFTKEDYADKVNPYQMFYAIINNISNAKMFFEKLIALMTVTVEKISNTVTRTHDTVIYRMDSRWDEIQYEWTKILYDFRLHVKYNNSYNLDNINKKIDEMIAALNTANDSNGNDIVVLNVHKDSFAAFRINAKEEEDNTDEEKTEEQTVEAEAGSTDNDTRSSVDSDSILSNSGSSDSCEESGNVTEEETVTETEEEDPVTESKQKTILDDQNMLVDDTISHKQSKKQEYKFNGRDNFDNSNAEDYETTPSKKQQKKQNKKNRHRHK